MLKKEFIDNLADKLDSTKADAERVAEAVSPINILKSPGHS